MSSLAVDWKNVLHDAFDRALLAAQVPVVVLDLNAQQDRGGEGLSFTLESPRCRGSIGRFRKGNNHVGQHGNALPTTHYEVPLKVIGRQSTQKFPWCHG
jgi:hypothetical protein